MEYPWRIASYEFGQECYESEEESFRNTKEAIHKPCIWQVYNNEVHEVAEAEFFKFYNNRAYIVLSIQEKDTTSPEGVRNLHVWVSKYCSRQDYQLAVARVDQLASMLKNPKPTVHREIQLYETEAFHDHEWILEVRRAESEDSPMRLLQFHIEDTTHRQVRRGSVKESSERLRKEWMVERQLLRGNLSTDDVFVLTNLNNFEIFQWNGRNSNQKEREKAEKFIEEEKKKFHGQTKLRANRIVVREGHEDKNHKMYALFPHTATKKKILANVDQKANKESYKKFYKLTNDSNGGFLPNVAQDRDRSLSNHNLDSDYVYLIDTDYHMFVWIGNDWKEKMERTNGRLPPLMMFFDAADRYLAGTQATNGEEYEEDMFRLPLNKPITLVNEDDQCLSFKKALRR